ncbi:MAG TPA: DUF308 domain-containing protein [Nitrososphaera sp.]|jgi:uncharacterized membrane protein HdeD (DUF308 family)
MTTTKVIGAKPPTWIRALQIGIGAIAIALSISAIIFPVVAIAAVFTVAAIILLLFGIERVVTGIFLYKQSRLTHIGLGILIIILSSLVMVYPLATATLVVWLAAIALLIVGISSLISGLKAKTWEESARRSSRFLTIGAGALAIALAITVMVVPTFGMAIAGIVIGIALLIYGIRLVVTGISRRHDNTVTPKMFP